MIATQLVSSDSGAWYLLGTIAFGGIAAFVWWLTVTVTRRHKQGAQQ